MDLKEKNKFSFDAYFTDRYGLPARPPQPHLGITATHVVLVLLIIGIFLIVLDVMKYNKQKQALADWQADYDYRKNNWDKEYDLAYEKVLKEKDLKNRAMKRLGLDEEEVTEAEPFSIYGPKYDGYYRFGTSDGVARTENVQITWLFFSRDQVFTYDITFSVMNRKKDVEHTQEFFYTDIVSVSTGTVVQDLKKENDKGKSEGGEREDYSIETEAFNLTVPGDKMQFAYTATETTTRSVQALKNLIRSRKTR